MRANKDDCTSLYLFSAWQTNKKTKPLPRPAWHQIVVQQTIQTAAHYVHRVYCVVQLGPTPFCQTKMMQILVVCYRDHITILFNEALQILLDLCLFFYFLFIAVSFEAENFVK
jgi:hypothetical protein